MFHKISAAQLRRQRLEAAKQRESYIRYLLDAVENGHVSLDMHKYTLIQTFDFYITTKLHLFEADLSAKYLLECQQGLARLVRLAAREEDLSLFRRVYEELRDLTLERAASLPLFVRLAGLPGSQKEYLRAEFGC